MAMLSAAGALKAVIRVDISDVERVSGDARAQPQIIDDASPGQASTPMPCWALMLQRAMNALSRIARCRALAAVAYSMGDNIAICGRHRLISII